MIPPTRWAARPRWMARTGWTAPIVGAVGLSTTLALYWLLPGPPTAAGVFFFALLLVGLVIERFRYKTLQQGRPGPPWVETGERFIDPASGATVIVFYNPADGQRKYVTV